MRAKRATILVTLLASAVASLWLGGAAVSGAGSPEVVYAEGEEGQPISGPQLSNDPLAKPDVETRSGSAAGLFLWIGALVSFTVFFVTMVLFRVEVRSEKAAARARRQRMEYYRDMRRYKEQLISGGRDNT